MDLEVWFACRVCLCLVQPAVPALGFQLCSFFLDSAILHYHSFDMRIAQLRASTLIYKLHSAQRRSIASKKSSSDPDKDQRGSGLFFPYSKRSLTFPFACFYTSEIATYSLQPMKKRVGKNRHRHSILSPAKHTSSSLLTSLCT